MDIKSRCRFLTGLTNFADTHASRAAAK